MYMYVIVLLLHTRSWQSSRLNVFCSLGDKEKRPAARAAGSTSLQVPGCANFSLAVCSCLFYILLCSRFNLLMPFGKVQPWLFFCSVLVELHGNITKFVIFATGKGLRCSQKSKQQPFVITPLFCL